MATFSTLAVDGQGGMTGSDMIQDRQEQNRVTDNSVCQSFVFLLTQSVTRFIFLAIDCLGLSAYFTSGLQVGKQEVRKKAVLECSGEVACEYMSQLGLKANTLNLACREQG